jgi:fused signal recognition particle receptor
VKIFSNFNFGKLVSGLSKTKDKLVNSVTEVLTRKAVIDESTIDELEETLISADISTGLSEKIITNLKTNLKGEKDKSLPKILELLKLELIQILNSSKSSPDDSSDKINIKPYVILIVGVNGVGKTTTIGKLANNFKNAKNKVIVGAADTFRAAANEQLDIWAQKAGVDIVSKVKSSDPSSVAYETVKKAIDEDYDVVLIDTAGRLHSKLNLMQELNKIRRAIGKLIFDAPHEIYLVLDATIGQNAVIQVNEFSKVTQLTGLIITKLDGTAKGGAIFQVCNQTKIPVKYIGIGEKLDDLQSFNNELFVEALFTQNKK